RRARVFFRRARTQHRSLGAEHPGDPPGAPGAIQYSALLRPLPRLSCARRPGQFAFVESACAPSFARSSAGYAARACPCFAAGMDSWLGPGDRLANVPVTLTQGVE